MMEILNEKVSGNGLIKLNVTVKSIFRMQKSFNACLKNFKPSKKNLKISICLH